VGPSFCAILRGLYGGGKKKTRSFGFQGRLEANFRSTQYRKVVPREMALTVPRWVLSRNLGNYFRKQKAFFGGGGTDEQGVLCFMGGRKKRFLCPGTCCGAFFRGFNFWHRDGTKTFAGHFLGATEFLRGPTIRLKICGKTGDPSYFRETGPQNGGGGGTVFSNSGIF